MLYRYILKLLKEGYIVTLRKNELGDVVVELCFDGYFYNQMIENYYNKITEPVIIDSLRKCKNMIDTRVNEYLREGSDIVEQTSCCGNCVHCDFEDYYDEETCDNISGYYCTLDREAFDYDNGHCDQYR